MSKGTRELAPGDLELLRSGLRSIALRVLADAEAADEAVQETLARALAALRNGRLKDPNKLGEFVAGIARHVIADVFRERQRTLPIEELPGPLAAGGVSPLDALVSADEVRRVQAALSALAPRDREILRLSFYEGLAAAELAARLGEPAERVRKRKSRPLDRLRRAFLGTPKPAHDGAAAATNRVEAEKPRETGRAG